jgi:lia operon protein LiaG
MRPRRLQFGIPLSCVALLPFAAAPVRAQTERHVISGERVAIYNLAGKLRVEGSNGSDVIVEVTRGGRDAEQLRIEKGVIGWRQTLRVVYPGDRVVYPELGRWDHTTISVASDGTWGDGERGARDRDRDRDRVEIRGSGSGLEAYADLRVLVPRGQRIVVHHAVGDARIANVDGDLSVDVASANIASEHTRGSLSLNTGSGSVTVTDAQGDVTLDTGSGGVTITGVKGGSLNMDTGSGTIRATDVDVSDLKADVGSGGVRLSRIRAPRVDVDAGSGGTELELLGTLEQLKVDAGSGGVTVRLPANTGAEIDVESGSGGIDTDFAVELRRFERQHMIGKIGDGRGRIRIESGSGHIRLLKG